METTTTSTPQYDLSRETNNCVARGEKTDYTKRRSIEATACQRKISQAIEHLTNHHTPTRSLDGAPFLRNRGFAYAE